MKKIIYILFLVTLTLNCFSSKRFEVSGGTGNWNSTTNWSLTSGGASGSAVPTSADSVVLDANSGNLTVNVAATCLTFNCTGYTFTLTMNNALQPLGDITFSAGMAISGTQFIEAHSTGTLTIISNGFSVPNLSFFNSGTYALGDILNCTNASFDATFTVNSNTLNISGSILGTGTSSGTTSILMSGTGGISLVHCYNRFTINTSGTITFGVGTINFGNTTTTWTHIAGTIVTTGSIVSFVNEKITCLSSLHFNKINFSGTDTINNDIIATSDCIMIGSLVTNGLFNIFVGGSISNSGSPCSGTATYVMNGTGSLTSAFNLSNPFVINTTGTVTIGNLIIGTNNSSLTYSAGTVSITPSSTLSLTGNCTINVPDVVWENITTTNNATLTINSLLSVNKTFMLTQSVTFNGSAGFTTNNLTATTASRIYVLGIGNVYTVTGNLIMGNASGSHTTLSSSSSGTSVSFILNPTGTQNVIDVNPTDIDSSLGVTIYDIGMVKTRTINWLATRANFNSFN